MESIRKKKIYFSVLIAFLPLISTYVSVLPGMDLGTFCILIFAVFSLSGTWHINEIMPLYIYVLLVTPISLLLSFAYDANLLTIILRYGKFIVVMGVVFGFDYINKYYDEKITFTTMKYIVYICTIFIILQRVVFYAFDFVLYNPFVRFATSDSYVNDTLDSATMFRPASFFLEPSHLSMYAVVYLIYSLFKKDDLKQSIIVSIAILCSGSGIGLVLVFLIYVAYFGLNFKKHVIETCFAMFAGTIALIWMSTLDFFRQVVARFATRDGIGGGNAIVARIGTGYQLFLENSLLEKIFGCGYGNVPVDGYLNAMTYMLNTIGVVGLLLYVILIFKYIIKGDTWQRMGLIVLLGLTVFSQIFAPGTIVFYLCIYGNISLKETTHGSSRKKEII